MGKIKKAAINQEESTANLNQLIQEISASSEEVSAQTEE